MILVRARLRDIVVSALKAANTLAAQNVYSPGDWPTATDNLPIILVKSPRERKQSMTRAQPNFTTTASIVVDARVQANNENDALVLLDTISGQIEQAVLTSYELIRSIQQVAFVETHSDVNSDNGTHIGQVLIEFGLEFFQAQEDYYAPVNPAAIAEMAVHADLKNCFDATGTYPASIFADQVTAAPRISGPDGRDEGLVLFQNLQS